MTTYQDGTALRECPLCGRNVRIADGTIECFCGLKFRLNNGDEDLTTWIDKHWNMRIQKRYIYKDKGLYYEGL